MNRIKSRVICLLLSLFSRQKTKCVFPANDLQLLRGLQWGFGVVQSFWTASSVRMVPPVTMRAFTPRR